MCDDPNHSELELQRRLAPTSLLYIRQGDNLQCTVYNATSSVSVGFVGYLLTPQRQVVPFTITVNPTTDRAATTKTEGIGEGWLLNLAAVLLSGTTPRAQTYVKATLLAGTSSAALPMCPLLQGYVHTTYSPNWPTGRDHGNLDGRGALKIITIPVPAAGAEFTTTVPAGARWEVLQVSALFTAAATVASRRPSLKITDGTNILGQYDHKTAITISGVAQLTWGAGVAEQNNVLTVQYTSLPNRLMMGAGYKLASSTANIDSGDAYTAIFAHVLEHLET